MGIKTKFITCKLFDNNLLCIHRIKTALTLNKLAYVEMCMLELRKVPLGLYQKQLWQQIKILTHRYWQLMYKIETENVCDDFSKN